MSDLRKEMREFGLDEELEDANEGVMHDALKANFRALDLIVRLKEKKEETIADFWRAEAERRANDAQDGPNIHARDYWMHKWCGCTGAQLRVVKTMHRQVFCGSPACSAWDRESATIPAIVLWHANKRKD